MAENEFSEDVEIYLEEVRRIPLLGAQEFHTLLLRAADGDEDNDNDEDSEKEAENDDSDL